MFKPSPPPTDSTASVHVLRKGFSRLTQDVYFLPVEISDNGLPSLSSTQTLTVRVCSCDSRDTILSCNVEPYVLPAGLSTGALIAILACIVILLGTGSTNQEGRSGAPHVSGGVDLDFDKDRPAVCFVVPDQTSDHIDWV